MRIKYLIIHCAVQFWIANVYGIDRNETGDVMRPLAPPPSDLVPNDTWPGFTEGSGVTVYAVASSGSTAIVGVPGKTFIIAISIDL